MAEEFYRLVFYVPTAHLESVKAAIFAAGAGRIGNYDGCCWQVQGTGQFRPLAGSNPFIGATDMVEQVEEYKVETVCASEDMEAIVVALRQAHPYETPAFQYWRVRG